MGNLAEAETIHSSSTTQPKCDVPQQCLEAWTKLSKQRAGLTEYQELAELAGERQGAERMEMRSSHPVQGKRMLEGRDDAQLGSITTVRTEDSARQEDRFTESMLAKGHEVPLSEQSLPSGGCSPRGQSGPVKWMLKAAPSGHIPAKYVWKAGTL